MPAISSLRAGLKTRLATITNLRTSDTVPDQVNPPHAIVGSPRIAYDVTMGGDNMLCVFPITIVVGRVAVAYSQDLLDSFLASSGSSSIKAAVEGDITLGGTAQTVRVMSAEPTEDITIANAIYLGCVLDVEVYA